jgi:hypothetical protein
MEMGRGDGVRPFLKGRRWDDSMMPEVDDTTKSGTAVREAKGGGSRLEVEDGQRKLGRWAECTVRPNCWLSWWKKYGWEYEMDQKDRRRNTGGPKQKRKRK